MCMGRCLSSQMDLIKPRLRFEPLSTLVMDTSISYIQDVFPWCMLCATSVYSLVRQDSKNCAWGDAWVLSWNLNKQSVHFKPLSVMDTSIANIQDVFPWCMLYAASVYSLVRQDTKQMISYKFKISLQSQIGWKLIDQRLNIWNASLADTRVEKINCSTRYTDTHPKRNAQSD